jgi:AAA domain-containing protein/bifunctional DNA primase/polymerase-like protein
MGVLETALDIVFRANLPVFPCGSTKTPVISRDRGGHGYKDATRDEEQVRTLFRLAGDRAKLVGVPCGEDTNFDVLDIDPRHGGDRWELENAHRLPETRVHISQNGGRHYLFRHAPGVRNSAGQTGSNGKKRGIADGVDVRGEGGYVIFPPSAGYFIGSDAEIADWPDWLLDVVLKHLNDVDPPSRPAFASSVRISERRLDAFVKAVGQNVSRASDGSKHFALRNAALSIGGIQEQAGLSDEEAAGVLLNALPRSVNNWANAKATIAWGLDRGKLKPLELLDRAEYAPRNGTKHVPLNGHGVPDRSVESESEPEKPTEPKTFPLLWFQDIEPSLEANDFVQGVLMEQSAIVVYGQSNSGKTFWATNLALHIAASMEWNGRRVNGGGVIYCIMESTIGFRNRVAAWKDHHGLEGHDLPFAAVTAGLDLRDAHNEDVDTLVATVKQAVEHIHQPVRLIIIDTLARALAGGDENAPDDMGALVKAMDRIREETSAAVLFIHHSGKDQARGARGHSSLQAAIDTEIEVVVDDAGEARTATIVKQREMKKGDAFTFSLEVKELGNNKYNEAVSTCIVVPGATVATPTTRLTGHNQRAYDILSDLIAGSGETGHGNVPPGHVSVPEAWWRDRFYDRAIPGGTDEAKRKAFRRAADFLVERGTVGMANRRVWLPNQRTDP